MRFFISMLIILVLAAGSAIGQTEAGSDNASPKKKYFYQWTDSKGVVHITDSLGKVPERYRDAARRIESQNQQKNAADQQKQPDTTSAPDSESDETDAKAEWQGRMREWKDRLAEAERHYRDLKQDRDELFRAWGSPALAPLENRQQAEQIRKEMEETRKEIDNARNMIKTVIPDEARKAGVPPGWLRE